MHVLFLILFILAAACFLAAAFNVVTNKVNLIGLGLFLAVLVSVIQQFRLVS